MRALVRGALTSAVTGSLMLVSCGSQEEPAGLDATTESTADSTTTPDNTPADAATTQGDDTNGTEGGTDDAGGTGEPRTFEQPFLPEKTEVELRDEIPVKVPDDAKDAEAEVAQAFGRYYAVTEQILWGVPIEDTDIESVAAGERLEAIRAYAKESVERERVTVGPPVSIHLVSVDTDGTDAHVDVCVDTRDRIDVYGDRPARPSDPLVRFDVELADSGEGWRVTRSATVDDLGPCEGVFE